VAIQEKEEAGNAQHAELAAEFATGGGVDPKD